MTQRCREKGGCSRGGQVSGVTSPGRRVGNDGGVRKKPNLVPIAPNAALPCQLMQPGGVRLSQRRCVGRRGSAGGQKLPPLGSGGAWRSVTTCQWSCGGSDALPRGEPLSWTCRSWWQKRRERGRLAAAVARTPGEPGGVHRSSRSLGLRSPPSAASGTACPKRGDTDHGAPAGTGPSLGLPRCSGVGAEKWLV